MRDVAMAIVRDDSSVQVERNIPLTAPVTC